MSEQELEAVEHDDPQAVEAEEVETPEADEPAAPPPKQWDDETEQEARLFGWKPSDEWVGEKPAGYIESPEEYLERVQRSRIFKTMQDKISEQERAFQENTRRMQAMQERALQKQRDEIEARDRMLQAAQRKAVDEADTEQWERLEQQRVANWKAREELAQPQEPEGPAAPPDVQEYANSEQGQWLKNPVLARTAAQLVDGNPAALQMTPKQQIEYAEAEIRRMYPAYFPQEEKQEKPKPAARVDGGGLATGAAGNKTQFGKLPADAKQQFQKFVEQGVFENTKADQEEYAREYFAA